MKEVVNRRRTRKLTIVRKHRKSRVPLLKRVQSRKRIKSIRNVRVIRLLSSMRRLRRLRRLRRHPRGSRVIHAILRKPMTSMKAKKLAMA